MNIIFIVNAIEPASVLKTELFATRLETMPTEAARDLKIAFFSARLEARVRELVKLLSHDVFSEKLETSPMAEVELWL